MYTFKVLMLITATVATASNTQEESNNAPSDVSVIFVLGGPGSGKGTQCELMAESYGFCHLSAGNLLRAEKKTSSRHADLINKCILDGELVPVEITVALILKAMKKAMDTEDTCDFLIDGFPRDLVNLDGWRKAVRETDLFSNVEVKYVLYFDCPEEVLQQRLLERGKTSGRTDDNLESIKKRFRTYQKMVPVIQYYEKQGKVHKVISDDTIENVFEEVKAVLHKTGYSDIQSTPWLLIIGLAVLVLIVIGVAAYVLKRTQARISEEALEEHDIENPAPRDG